MNLPLDALPSASPLALPGWLPDAGFSGPDAELVRRAAKVALHAAADPELRREMERSLGTAGILVDLKLDPESVAAALLLGVAENYRALAPQLVAPGERAPETAEEWLAGEFGPGVARLVASVLKTRRIGDLTRQEAGRVAGGLEALRKMVLAMADDIRVVLILLAERTWIMRELSGEPEDARRSVARLTMDLFAPLANRLGIWQVKWELEDLSFRYLQPELYRKIAGLLDERRADRERFIEEAMARLRTELQAAGIEGEVTGRPKHIYSIYRKMQHKRVGFSELYDVRAVRVLVRQVKDCYTVLGIVHNLWQPIPGEFDDYISHPKGNNYRSLHTAVLVEEGKALEVQIRTYEMHHDSELGVAAHWRYKEGGRADREFEARIALLRQLLEWKQELAESTALPGQARGGLFEDTVYVLTPQGRVIDLPAGSTPLDFAYHVHTELGHRCRGAKVDGNIVPLNYRLQNAQRVEIIAAKQGGPSRDWLNPQLGYLHSPRALAKVRQWFRQQFHEEQVAQGRTVLEKEMQRLGQTGYNLEKLAHLLHCKDTDEMLAAIGRGEITPRTIELALQGDQQGAPGPQPAAPITAPSKATGASSGILVLGVNNIATVLAKCCKPVPPDPIVGFVTRTRGVSVHRADCPNVAALDAPQRERTLPAAWGRTGLTPFAVDIEVTAADRQGLLRDIVEALARERVNITATNTQSRGLQAVLRFTLEIHGLEQLGRVLKQLQEVPGVIAAARR